MKKHGEKAGEQAERHADVSNFGRKDASGKYKGLPKSRIEKSDYRTTASGKMHKQDQAELKRELRIRRGKKLRSEEIELDIFDTILEFLQTEGYENPEQLMIELSSDHIDAILEAQEARNNPEKYEGEQDKKSAPVRGERRPMPPRGHKDREAFERWYAANVR